MPASMLSAVKLSIKLLKGGQVVCQVNVVDSKNVKQDKAERRLTKVLNDNNVQVNNVFSSHDERYIIC
jgi:hypothetical protein